MSSKLQWLQALKKPRLGRAVKQIIEDPGQDYSLKSLASLCAMSRTTFATRFMESFGRSAMDFVKEMRLSTAARLLVQTDMPVKSICTKVGYESRSHFTHAFSELYGSTPSEYRETHVLE